MHTDRESVQHARRVGAAEAGGEVRTAAMTDDGVKPQSREASEAEVNLRCVTLIAGGVWSR